MHLGHTNLSVEISNNSVLWIWHEVKEASFRCPNAICTSTLQESCQERLNRCKNYAKKWRHSKERKFIHVPSKSNTTRLGYGVSTDDVVSSTWHVSTAPFNSSRDFGLKAPECGIICTVCMKARTTNMMYTPPETTLQQAWQEERSQWRFSPGDLDLISRYEYAGIVVDRATICKCLQAGFAKPVEESGRRVLRIFRLRFMFRRRSFIFGGVLVRFRRPFIFGRVTVSKSRGV